MKHLFWIIPNRLAGRPGPSLQPWSLGEIRAGGIDAVLNVSEFGPDRAEFESAGIGVAWVPLPNTYPADAETEDACLLVVPKAYEFLKSNLDANRNVLVHCAWGRDRTGLLLALHLANTTNLSPRECIARVRQFQPKALTAAGWLEMAVRIIGKLSTPSQRDLFG